MAITQPKVIRPERNSNVHCNSSQYSHLPNIKSIYQRTSKKSPDNFKFELKYKFKSHNSAKNHSTGTNSSLICNSSRYSQMPNIKSIYQRTSRKSPDNLTFEQKYKFRGHNSAKYHSTGTKFERKL